MCLCESALFAGLTPTFFGVFFFWGGGCPQDPLCFRGCCWLVVVVGCLLVCCLLVVYCVDCLLFLFVIVVLVVC